MNADQWSSVFYENYPIFAKLTHKVMKPRSRSLRRECQRRLQKRFDLRCKYVIMYEWHWRHLMTCTEKTHTLCTLSYCKQCVTLLLTNETGLFWRSAQLKETKVTATILKPTRIYLYSDNCKRDKVNEHTLDRQLPMIIMVILFVTVSEIRRVQSCARFSSRRAKIHVRQHDVPLQHPACSVPTASRKVAHFCQTSRFQLELSLAARVVPSFVIRPRDSGSAAAARWSDTIKNIQRYFEQLWAYL